MSKVILNSVADLTQSSTAQTTINTNSSTVQTAFDNTLSRDGTSPNQMGATLDMNSNQIINLPAPSTINSPARVIDVVTNPTITIPGTGTSGHVVPFLDGANTWSGNNSIPGVWSNIRLAKTTNYTVLNADKGSTIALSTGGQTLTFNAASGYDANFRIAILNEDASRAWIIAASGLTNFFLYPGQSIELYASNNTWHVIGKHRWKLPASITIHVNSSLGNDSNDGLASGSGNAKATVIAALYQVMSDFDRASSSSSDPAVTIQLEDNDTTGVHFGTHGLVGAGSGGSITLDGGGFSISNAGDTDDALHLFFGTVMYLQNITVVGGTNHGGLYCEMGAKVFIKAGVTFSSTGNSTHLRAKSGGIIEIDSSYTVASGGGIQAWAGHQGLIFAPSAITITFSANSAFSSAGVLATQGGMVDFINVTYALGGFTITGKRWEADSLAAVISRTAAPDTFFPGSIVGSTSGGGQGL